MNSIDQTMCPVHYALGIIGGKWKLHILCVLYMRTPARYSEIKRKVRGITNMMLTQSLKELEASGIVSRKQYNEIPPRVEYSLTEDGQTLLPVLEHMGKWGEAQLKKAGGYCDCEACQR